MCYKHPIRKFFFFILLFGFTALTFLFGLVLISKGFQEDLLESYIQGTVCVWSCIFYVWIKSFQRKFSKQALLWTCTTGWWS